MCLRIFSRGIEPNGKEPPTTHSPLPYKITHNPISARECTFDSRLFERRLHCNSSAKVALNLKLLL